VLIASIAFLVAANVVYQVSSVELAHQRELEAWKAAIESQFGYTSCLVLDDSVRTIRILSLRCRKTTLKYVHVAEGGTWLGETDASVFNLSERRQWALERYGQSISVSVTYFDGITVLRVWDTDQELLIDPLSLEELWKVTWNDE
jgi:hypothetical protein